jgi:hypothetical protein
MAAAGRDDPFREDARLRQTLTVRVSGMPLVELFPRLGALLGVRLFAEGEDVAEQKINLFATDLPAAEILTAIAGLLNAEGPRGSRWERSGKASNPRYVLVRDLASRQWEERQLAAATARLASLLRDRLRALGEEPFTPGRAHRWELPAMRKLLGSLSDAQLAQLARMRFLKLTALWQPMREPLWKELAEQSVAAVRRHDPEGVQRKIDDLATADLVSQARAHIRLYGDPTRYIVRVAVSTPAGGEGMARLCEFSDPEAFEDRAAPSRGPATADGRVPPVFALPEGASWLMGDVLMDLAARAGIHLIADDYTVNWSTLVHPETPESQPIEGAQPLSVWLDKIQEEFGFAVAQDGPFLRLPNRHWWYERSREIPRRKLSRWVQLSSGTFNDRLEAAVEIARWAPLGFDLPFFRLHLGRLAENQEMKELSKQFEDPGEEEVSPGFTEVVAYSQTELRIYGLLPPRQQQAIREGGLTLSWREMPPAARALFARSVRTVWSPGVPEERIRESSLWLRFHDEHILLRYQIPGVRPGQEKWQRFIFRFAPARPVRASGLVGERLPELQVEEPGGKRITLPPVGPLLLYAIPAWPRPLVSREEAFTDLRALQRLRAELPEGSKHVFVLGTDATAAELRDWWKARGLALPPLALLPASAERLGVRHLPVALVVDGNGRITWAKEGYTAGDEAAWRRELADRASRGATDRPGG